MANTTEGGFRVYIPRSSCPCYEVKQVASGYATAIFKGDVLKLMADGSVAVALAGETIYGIMDGVDQYLESGVLRKGTYLPANTVWGTNLANQSKVRVILAAGVTFEVDADDGVTANTEAAFNALIGTNCDHAVGAGGSTINGISSHALDISTFTAIASAGWRIVGLSPRLDNDFTSTRAKVLVTVNEGIEPQFSAIGV